jgi:hypothetical protein
LPSLKLQLLKGENMRRALINPPLKLCFKDVYRAISEQPKSQTPQLLTTGDVPFVAEAKCTHDGRLFISLPHNNRIYENDWGYRSNNMGKDGQRIGHYSKPIDDWASRRASYPYR